MDSAEQTDEAFYCFCEEHQQEEKEYDGLKDQGCIG